MRLHTFILAALLPFLGSCPLAFALDHSDKVVIDLSDEEIKEGMAHLIHAIDHEIAPNQFFSKPEEIHTFINHFLQLDEDDIMGILGLEEILFHLQKSKNINQDNYPAPLVRGIKKRLKAVYRHYHHIISNALTDDSLTLQGMASAWIGLAMGDKIICGTALAVHKVLHLHESKATFQDDFEAMFSNHDTLYTISPRLKVYIKNTSQFIEQLRHQPGLFKKYKLAKLAKLLQEGNMTNTINAAMRNIYNGDHYVSLHLLEVFAGLNIDGAFEKLTALLNQHNSIPHYDKTAADIKMFLDIYYSLYGKKHPKKPKPLYADKKQADDKPKKDKKAQPQPEEPKVQPVAPIQAPVEKRPPEKPGYTLGKYADGKWWYFRRNLPVMKAPQ